MDFAFGSRLKHAWNAFTSNKDPTRTFMDIGSGYGYRPDRPRFSMGNERSIITSVFNRIAMDVAAIDIKHVRLDKNGRFLETIDSALNNCLSLEANFDIDSLRVAKILEWYPAHVRLRVYNELKGEKEDIILPKRFVCIIENPLYAVINEPNSTMKRLIRKLSLLDVTDEQTASGKLDLIIQLPYVIKTEARRQQAENRRRDIEQQLAGSKYGIAYTDGTEHITQLNRSLENNLMKQVEYLTSLLFSQLGITQSILDGTADEKTMLNYYSRTIEPIVSAIVDEMKRKFLTKTARSQKQDIMYFRDPFKLVPVDSIAEIADKFTRNEIMTSNEIRQVIGMRPSSDPKADELVNSNISQPNSGNPTEQNTPVDETGGGEESEEDSIVNDLLNSLEEQINSIIDGYMSGDEEVVDDDG